MYTCTYTDVAEVIGDHAGEELRRLAERNAAMAEGGQVIAAGADDE
jgi:hypothetical protein